MINVFKEFYYSLVSCNYHYLLLLPQIIPILIKELTLLYRRWFPAQHIQLAWFVRKVLNQNPWSLYYSKTACQSNSKNIENFEFMRLFVWSKIKSWVWISFGNLKNPTRRKHTGNFIYRDLAQNGQLSWIKY